MITTLANRQQSALALPRLSSAVVVRVQAQQQQQARAFVSPSQTTLFATSSADIDKGVQNITELFMTARDEVLFFCRREWTKHPGGG
jgi:hypothetical protein